MLHCNKKADSKSAVMEAPYLEEWEENTVTLSLIHTGKNMIFLRLEFGWRREVCNDNETWLHSLSSLISLPSHDMTVTGQLNFCLSPNSLQDYYAIKKIYITQNASKNLNYPKCYFTPYWNIRRRGGIKKTPNHQQCLVWGIPNFSNKYTKRYWLHFHRPKCISFYLKDTFFQYSIESFIFTKTPTNQKAPKQTNEKTSLQLAFIYMLCQATFITFSLVKSDHTVKAQI